MRPEPRLIEVRKNVLKQNDVVARSSPRPLSRRRSVRGEPGLQPRLGQDCIPRKNSHSASPKLSRGGSGRATLPPKMMRCVWRAARPQSSKSRPALSVTSKPPWLQSALEEWDLNQLDFLFIENVGNLVCPSSYDLGEDLRLVLISVTEGEDKPLKYPDHFQQRRRRGRHES